MISATLTTEAHVAGIYEPSVSLSADGRWLAFVSFNEASRLGSVFLRDTVAGTTQAVTSSLAGGDNYSAVIAAGGTALAFTTMDAAGGVERIAVANLASGSIAYASATASGAAANGDSRFASISANGRYVAFDSAATNLVAGDTNGADDVFVKDMASGAVLRVSVGSTGLELAGGAEGALISADGNVVLFRSMGEVIPGAAPASSYQLYARNLASGALTMVTANSAGKPSDAIDDCAALSADGRYVVFSAASRFANDGNGNYDIFRKDLATGAVELVSASSAGVQGAGWASDPSISADGRFVSFTYDASDLNGAPASSNSEIYIKDMQTGVLSAVSRGEQPGQGSFAPAFSGDGAHLAYVRYAGIQGINYDVSWEVVMANLSTPASTAPAPETVGAPAPPASLAWGSMSGASEMQAGPDLQGMADSGARGQVFRLYQAAFDRAPDAEGLAHWLGALAAGDSIQAVAGGFVHSDEFAALYGAAPAAAQVVDALYLNALHRGGEEAGLAFWNTALDAGRIGLAETLAGFSESAELLALVGVQDHGYTPFG